VVLFVVSIYVGVYLLLIYVCRFSVLYAFGIDPYGLYSYSVTICFSCTKVSILCFSAEPWR
jgi:hypothetical protein